MKLFKNSSYIFSFFLITDLFYIFNCMRFSMGSCTRFSRFLEFFKSNRNRFSRDNLKRFSRFLEFLRVIARDFLGVIALEFLRVISADFLGF